MDALTILHLSDIHFGRHQFDPPPRQAVKTPIRPDIAALWKA